MAFLRARPRLPLKQNCAFRANSHRVILGVDPSLRGTGYGVIRLAKPHPLALAHGTISCPPGWERSRCLVQNCRRRCAMF